jgi:hypothetical protein
MKQKFLSYIAIALIVVSASCKKGGDNLDAEPVPTNNNGAFSGKVNDVNYQSLEVGCISEHEENGSFLLAATDKNENNIILVGPNRVGTFTSTSEDDDIGGIYQEKDGKMWMSDLDGGTTTITIKKFDKSSNKISGTFSFTAPAFTSSNATGTKVVTGSFTDVKYAVGNTDDDDD